MGIAYTFYKGVFNYEELMEYLVRSKDLPDCEMFCKLSEGDEELVKGKGYIAQEDTDDDLCEEIPVTLREALGLEKEVTNA